MNSVWKQARKRANIAMRVHDLKLTFVVENQELPG